MPSQASLEQISMDLVFVLADLLESRDLASLAQASRKMRALVGKVLWQTLVVRPFRPDRVNSIAGRVPSSIPVRHVRHRHFRAGEAVLRESRCIHWDRAQWCSTGSRKYRPEPRAFFIWPRFDELSAKAADIVARVRRGQLRSFSWDMGTCLPEAVLRQLAKTQSQIDSLTLTTDSRCDRWPQDNAALVDKLVNLEHLCWTGPPDLAALAALLIPRDRGPDRGSALSSLGLSWITRDAYQHARDRGLGFARQVWIDPLRARGVAPRPPRSFHMPWLRRLSLYRVPVARDLFSHILDLDALQSLSLRDCPRWHLAMNHAVDRGARPFSLQTLEIKSSASVCLHKRQSAEQRRWLGFLDHIVAVDDVFCFEVVCRDVVADLWHHFSRLGDLASSHVLHYRAANRAESPYAALDLADLGMVHQDMTLLHDPFANSACRSLGVSCDPHYLRAFLQAFVAKDTLELVHIRQSFRDIELVGSWNVRSPLPYNGVPKYACQHVLQRSLLGFVEWAFGDEGISSLQVIIIGDYAHGDCILEHNFIMVRDEHEDSGFRLVDVREDESALVLHENRRLIGACPVTLPPTAAAELKQERDGAGLAYWPPGSSQRQPVAEFDDDDDDDDDPDTADDQDQPTEEEAEADEAASDDATEESGDGSDETNPDGPEAHESSDEPDDDESEQTEAED